MRTGLFGGTFDPIHIGHLIIADTVRSDYPLDRILFIPAGIPPHKDNRRITPVNLRLEMVKAAVKPYLYFEVSDWEIRKKGAAYTIDTIRGLRASKTWGSDDLYFLMGADSLLELETWKNPDAILKEIPTLVVGRPDFDVKQAAPRFRERITFVPTPHIGISSTEIRQRVREGKSIRTWVPERVEAFIRQKGLYL